MSEFIGEYKALRKEGRTDYEALALTSELIANDGTIDDLRSLFRYYNDEFWEEAAESLRPRGVSQSEQAMKDAGHKLSDFM